MECVSGYCVVVMPRQVHPMASLHILSLSSLPTSLLFFSPLISIYQVRGLTTAASIWVCAGLGL